MRVFVISSNAEGACDSCQHWDVGVLYDEDDGERVIIGFGGRDRGERTGPDDNDFEVAREDVYYSCPASFEAIPKTIPWGRGKGVPCCDATWAEILDCIRTRPKVIGTWTPWRNCQTDIQEVLHKCCYHGPSGFGTICPGPPNAQPRQ